MKGTIIQKIYSGCFIVYVIQIDGGIHARTYTGKVYGNYTLWGKLKVGDCVDGLRWKDENRKIVDADSLVHLTQ